MDPRYRHKLTSRSLATVRSQGGLLDPDERDAFEAASDFTAQVVLRLADDAAKVPGRPVVGLEAWRTTLADLAAR